MLKHLGDALLDRGWGKVLGLALFLAGLLQYRSYANRPIFGLWSYSFFAVILLATLAVIVSVIHTLKTKNAPTHEARLSSRSLALATLLWGGGYVISAMDEPDNGARIVDFNVIGSVHPAAVVFEWGALACAVVALVQTLWLFRRHSWGRVGLMALPLAAVLVSAEGLARIVAVIDPEPQGFPTYRSKQWERRYVELNSLGFRDSEHTLAAEPNVRRLLIIGDSYAFGWGLKHREDRFGEKLGARLAEMTGTKWEVMTACRPDTHTLVHLDFMRQMLPYRPDLVILLYVFNDIDYLAMVTPREGQSERPRSLWEHVDPIRLLYRNLYLFQEMYIRARQLDVSAWVFAQREKAQPQDPYWNQAFLAQHLQDVSKLVNLAAEAAAKMVIVPFDVAITEHQGLQQRYGHFVNQAVMAGIPTWPASGAFTGYTFDQLTVNRLDRHPNELANRLLAEFVSDRAVAILNERQENGQ